MEVLLILLIISSLSVLGFSIWQVRQHRTKLERLKGSINAAESLLEINRVKNIRLEVALESKKEIIKQLDSEIEEHRNQLENTIEQSASLVQTMLEKEQTRAEEAFSAFMSTLEEAYNATEAEHDEKVAALQAEFQKWKSAQDAIIQARLREQELNEKENFYKISLTEDDLQDIETLENIKPHIKKPEILSKLIWTTYYQKGIGNLCSNVLGDKTVCGIYKLTDTTTDLIYIGQSVNVAQRWKDHVKSALGAAPTASSNRLYAQMQKSGVHNFTFELIEEVPSVDLNEKEKYYINFYQSNVYGLNGTKGNK